MKPPRPALRSPSLLARLTLPICGAFLSAAPTVQAAPAANGGAPAKPTPAVPAGAGGAPAPSAAPAAAAPARPWQDVAKDVVEALGGRARLEKKHALYEKIAVSLSTLKIEGTVESWTTKDNKTLRVTNLTGIPTTREGSDGNVYWSQDPVNGLRILEGHEKEQARVESAWMAELRLGKLFEKIESHREATSSGQALECLVMTMKGPEAEALINCYDAQTHLQFSQRGKHASPQGPMPFASYLSDYRDVDGVKLPFMNSTSVGPVTFTARIQEAKWDVSVKDVAFGLPSTAGKKGAAKASPKAPASAGAKTTP